MHCRSLNHYFFPTNATLHISMWEVPEGNGAFMMEIIELGISGAQHWPQRRSKVLRNVWGRLDAGSFGVGAIFDHDHGRSAEASQLPRCRGTWWLTLKFGGAFFWIDHPSASELWPYRLRFYQHPFSKLCRVGRMAGTNPSLQPPLASHFCRKEVWGQKLTESCKGRLTRWPKILLVHPGAYEGLTDCDRTIGYDRWLNTLTDPFLVLKKTSKIELGTLSKVKNTGDSRFVHRPLCIASRSLSWIGSGPFPNTSLLWCIPRRVREIRA